MVFGAVTLVTAMSCTPSAGEPSSTAGPGPSGSVSVTMPDAFVSDITIVTVSFSGSPTNWSNEPDILTLLLSSRSTSTVSLPWTLQVTGSTCGTMNWTTKWPPLKVPVVMLPVTLAQSLM